MKRSYSCTAFLNTAPGRLKHEQRSPRAKATLTVRRVSINLAFALIGIYSLAATGNLDWQQVGTWTGAPWSALLNREWGSKAVQLAFGEALAFLTFWRVNLLFEKPGLRQCVGEGTITLFRRLMSFVALLPAVAAAYLLLRISTSTLRTDILYHGEWISLTLPTLLCTLVFGIAASAILPVQEWKYLPSPADRVASLAVVPAAAAVVLALDHSFPDPWIGASSTWEMLSVQMGLLSVEANYLLAILETARADWNDFRILRPRGTVPAVGALVRAVARLVVLTAPIGLGFWLALGATLSSASTILD